MFSRQSLSIFLGSAVLLIATRLEKVSSFVIPSASFSTVGPSSTLMLASKKKKSVLSPGKGFSKQQEEKSVIGYDDDQDNNGGLLVSLEEINSTKYKSTTVPSDDSNNINNNNKPVEERTKDILRQKYGLTSMEEKLGMLEKIDNMEARIKKQKKLEMKAKEKDEDESFLKLLPPGVVSGLSSFLRVGTGISVALFVLAGIGITWEAWIVSIRPDNVSIPPQVEDFITQVVEPNFTLGLFVLLAFSISLGLLTSAQLGSSSAVYKEKE